MSMISMARPFIPIFPVPSGAFNRTSERRQLIYIYSLGDAFFANVSAVAIGIAAFAETSVFHFSASFTAVGVAASSIGRFIYKSLSMVAIGIASGSGVNLGNIGGLARAYHLLFRQRRHHH